MTDTKTEETAAGATETRTETETASDTKTEETRPRLTKERVMGWVKEAIGEMFPNAKSEEDPGEEETPEHPTGAQVEDDFEAKTRAVVEKIQGESQEKEESSRIKTIVEAVPQAVTRTQRFMWGSGEKAKAR